MSPFRGPHLRGWGRARGAGGGAGRARRRFPVICAAQKNKLNAFSAKARLAGRGRGAARLGPAQGPAAAALEATVCILDSFAKFQKMCKITLLARTHGFVKTNQHKSKNVFENNCILWRATPAASFYGDVKNCCRCAAETSSVAPRRSRQVCQVIGRHNLSGAFALAAFVEPADGIGHRRKAQVFSEAGWRSGEAAARHAPGGRVVGNPLSTSGHRSVYLSGRA